MATQLLCTELDVTDLAPQLYQSGESNEYPVLSLAQVRAQVAKTDGQIRSALRQLYGSDLTISPWAASPEAKSTNTGTGVLSDATIGASAITELWTITFSSTTAFSVSGALSGGQGSGTTGSAFTSTNSYLVIPTANWSGTPAASDKFYVRVYEVDALLVDCSAHLAAAVVLQAQYTEQNPNASAAAAQYVAYVWGQGATRDTPKVIGLLQRLMDSHSGIELSKGMSTRNLDPIQVDWEISDEGEDVTNYAEKEWDSVG
jgi:hypothetical protein